MLDKNELIKFLIEKISNYNNLALKTKDHFFNGIVEGLGLVLEAIDEGDFYINEKTKETCKWRIVINKQLKDDYYTFIPRCQIQDNDKYITSMKKKLEFSFCPYCSKPAEVVENE